MVTNRTDPGSEPATGGTYRSRMPIDDAQRATRPPDVNADPRVRVAAANLRDLGGPTIADGRRVRAGRLFRSGHLADLSPEERATVDGLGLRTVVDLRRPAEAQARPTPDLDGSEVVALSVSSDDNEFAVAANSMVNPSAEPHGIDDVAAYFRGLAVDRVDRYRPVLRVVVDPDRHPVLFHCTAGKDRTGVVAAILLRLLGASDDDVAADYLLSNEVRRPMIETLEVDHRRRIADHLGVDEADVPDDRMATSRALLWCHVDYLEALFAGIDERYGSWTTFVADGLGLGDDQLSTFRSAILS